MTVIRRHSAAFVIVCLFVALGVIYSVSSPLFEPSDEHNHYPFVQHLATGGGLPVQRAGELIADRHRIPLPAGLSSGEYGLKAGMYQPEPPRNLPIDPPTPDGRVDLGTVRLPAGR